MAPFEWDKRRILAAQLAADDVLTNEEIATKCGVKRQTLDLWKLRPAFQERVAAICASYRAKVEAEGIANKQNRVDALNERWRKLHQVANERGDDLAMADIPGGTTGYLVHQKKQLGGGPSAQIIDEYVLDTGLLSELRAHELQAAKELGQWTERQETTGKNGGPIEQEITHRGSVEVRAVDYRQAASPLRPVELSAA